MPRSASFAHDVLAQLERIAAVMPLPRVVALHRPPDAACEAARAAGRGAFCALELDDGSLGPAYVLLDTLQPMSGDGGVWQGLDALALARCYADPGSPHRALGFAAVNALTRSFHDRAGYCPADSADSLGELTAAPGERIGMVGLFTPLLARLCAAGAQVTVLELREDLLAQPPAGIELTLDPARLAGCRQILCTSTVLLNDTLDAVLAQCRQAESLTLIGPGASCLPDGLFARGVTALGGTWIVDAAAHVRGLTTGEVSPGASRKVLIRRADYPGFDALLARLR